MKAKKERAVQKRKSKRREEPKKLMVERENVFFVGLNELDPFDQQRIKDIIYNEYIKIERELQHVGALKLHFKKYERGGRVKWSVHMFLDVPMAKPIVATSVCEPVKWDAVATVHKLLDKIRREIIHRYKTDTSYRKPYF